MLLTFETSWDILLPLAWILRHEIAVGVWENYAISFKLKYGVSWGYINLQLTFGAFYEI